MVFLWSESQRWFSVVLFAMPHFSEQNTEFNVKMLKTTCQNFAYGKLVCNSQYIMSQQVSMLIMVVLRKLCIETDEITMKSNENH